MNAHVPYANYIYTAEALEHSKLMQNTYIFENEMCTPY